MTRLFGKEKSIVDDWHPYDWRVDSDLYYFERGFTRGLLIGLGFGGMSVIILLFMTGGI